MAKNENIVSMTFNSFALAEPQDFAISCKGEDLTDSAGIDRYLSANELNRRHIRIRCVFKDWDAAMTMVTTHWGTKASLVLVTRALGTVTAKTTTIANCRCTGVDVNAAHAEIGHHVAEFLAVGSDGATNPAS